MKDKVSFLAIVALASPALMSQFISAPIVGIVPGLYAKEMGLSLGAIGLVVLVSRIFDAATDPFVGILSDRFQLRWRTRKPWLVLGFGITALAAWYISLPSEKAGIFYFAAWSMLFFLGWTMIEVPHNAWVAEVTRQHTQRTSLFFAKTLFAALGTLAFALVPMLPVFASNEFSFETMRATALIFLVGGLICVLCALFFAPSGRVGPAKVAHESVFRSIGSMMANGPFRRFLLAFLISGLAAGMNGTLQFLFMDVYLGLGDRVPIVLGAGVFLGMFGIAGWYFILLHTESHKAWSVSLAIGAVWIALPALLVPGEGSFIPYLIAFAGMVLSVGAGLIAPYTLLGNIIDYDRWRTGRDRAGAYFAIFLFTVKLNTALGGAAAFFLLDLTAFNPEARVQSLAGAWGIKSAFALLPGLLFLIGASVMWRYPLSRKVHDEIVSELDSG